MLAGRERGEVREGISRRATLDGAVRKGFLEEAALGRVSENEWGGWDVSGGANSVAGKTRGSSVSGCSTREEQEMRRRRQQQGNKEHLVLRTCQAPL